MDPEKKSLNGLFSLLNMESPKVQKVSHWLSKFNNWVVFIPDATQPTMTGFDCPKFQQGTNVGPTPPGPMRIPRHQQDDVNHFLGSGIPKNLDLSVLLEAVDPKHTFFGGICEIPEKKHVFICIIQKYLHTIHNNSMLQFPKKNIEDLTEAVT